MAQRECGKKIENVCILERKLRERERCRERDWKYLQYLFD